MILNINLKKPAWGLIILAWLLLTLGVSSSSMALTPLPAPDPQPGGFGVEATKKQAPPTSGATITTPGDGASFSTSPIPVRGICPSGLLVQLYNNGVMVGSVMCQSGSFAVEVSLFSGKNELEALVFDDLGQAGPKSNKRTVNYSNTDFAQFGEMITLTSAFGRRSAQTGAVLSWPLQLSGGSGPYAFSIDWGDGSDAELLSRPLSGVIGIDHVYKRAGIYRVNIKVTDVNDVTAFLQVIAVSNGEVDEIANAEKDGKSGAQPAVLWIPAAATVLLLFPAFWLGRLSQTVSLRNRMLKERDNYQRE